MVLILSACSSNDEPEPEYTGPWIIGYYEDFYKMHTTNPEFPLWFNTHTDCFELGEIELYNGSTERFTKLESNETYDTFKEVYNNKSGRFVWLEIVQHATESEMQKKKADFERFSMEYKHIRQSDKFEANFQKYAPNMKYN